MIKIDIIGKSAYLNYKEIEGVVIEIEKVLKLSTILNKVLEIEFVDINTIKKLNNRYRKKNLPTDVLSFPQSQIPGKVNLLGSIVICEKFSKDCAEETKSLIIHGFLHLLGFDHQIDQERWDKAIQKIGIK